MNINKLLTASLLTLLMLGNTAIAGEEAPRDEYSIGLVWDADDVAIGQSQSRVNLLMNNSDNNDVLDSDSMFPEFEH